jgi:hypothetical protein
MSFYDHVKGNELLLKWEKLTTDISSYTFFFFLSYWKIQYTCIWIYSFQSFHPEKYEFTLFSKENCISLFKTEHPFPSKSSRYGLLPVEVDYERLLKIEDDSWIRNVVSVFQNHIISIFRSMRMFLLKWKLIITLLSVFLPENDAQVKVHTPHVTSSFTSVYL